jgi:hypothetical protein
MRLAGIGQPGGSPQVAAGSVRTYARVFPARLDQVRAARRFMTGILDGCPAAGDLILCMSELAANAVIHSSSSRPGGVFTVRAEVLRECYARIEVQDGGGRWHQRSYGDGRPHGLDIVSSLAAESGVRGCAVTGWISWVRIDWPG